MTVEAKGIRGIEQSTGCEQSTHVAQGGRFATNANHRTCRAAAATSIWHALMTTLPPPIPRQETSDGDHLRLIAVFHYVFAGFAVLGLGFLFVHYTIMSTVFDNPEMWKNAKGTPPPPQFFAAFKWFYLFFGVIVVLGGVANLVSARCIQKRRGRMFSLVVAGISCLQIPFGTALGVFTFIVLLRESVRGLYAQSERDAAAAGGTLR